MYRFCIWPFPRKHFQQCSIQKMLNSIGARINSKFTQWHSKLFLLIYTLSLWSRFLVVLVLEVLVRRSCHSVILRGIWMIQCFFTDSGDFSLQLQGSNLCLIINSRDLRGSWRAVGRFMAAMSSRYVVFHNLIAFGKSSPNSSKRYGLEDWGLSIWYTPSQQKASRARHQYVMVLIREKKMKIWVVFESLKIRKFDDLIWKRLCSNMRN